MAKFLINVGGEGFKDVTEEWEQMARGDGYTTPEDIYHYGFAMIENMADACKEWGKTFDSFVREDAEPTWTKEADAATVTDEVEAAAAVVTAVAAVAAAPAGSYAAEAAEARARHADIVAALRAGATVATDANLSRLLAAQIEFTERQARTSEASAAECRRWRDPCAHLPAERAEDLRAYLAKLNRAAAA